MKMEAMTTFMKDQKDIKKVYLLNQNYSHGQQVAKYAKEYLERKRPDIEIVGEDLHPLGAGARLRAVHREDQGLGRRYGDHRQLGLGPVAAREGGANEGGYNGKFFTYYTGVTGTPTALGTTGAGKVYQVAYSHYNMGGQMDAWMKEFKAKYNDDFYTGSIVRIHELLGEAMAQGQVDRPGQGRVRAGRHEVQECVRRRESKCASPTTSCSSRCT